MSVKKAFVKKIKEDKSEAWKEYQKPIFKVRDDLNSFFGGFNGSI